MVNSLEFKKDIKKEFGINTKCIYNPLNTSENFKIIKKKQKNFLIKRKILKY